MAAGRKTGGGSRKGRPNKATRQLREMILAALDQAGGVDYLADQARAEPVAFLSLLARILPTQISGPDGAPIETRDTSLDRLESRLARLAAPGGTAGDPGEPQAGESTPA